MVIVVKKNLNINTFVENEIKMEYGYKVDLIALLYL